MTEILYQTRWRHKKRLELILEYGDICYMCLQPNLLDSNIEFHHIHPTAISGMGRGYDNRIRDIIKHKDCYITVCRSCHEKLHGYHGYKW